MIDIFSDGAKSCDKFSNLKSANFLIYSVAALYAKEKKLNDCLVLNTKGNIADSTIANVFTIKDGVIITPGLDEGCINGVKRRHLLNQLRDGGEEVQEMAITVADIEAADELFLTNAINGIRWVRQFGNKNYANTKTAEIYNRFLATISP